MKNGDSQKDILYLCLRTEHGLFRVGSLSMLNESSGKALYEFDIDEVRYKIAERITTCMIPGFDPEYGWLQRHDKEMQFIYERTFNKRRLDLEEVLKPFGMKAKGYNKWDFLKVSGGKYFLDNWELAIDESVTY